MTFSAILSALGVTPKTPDEAKAAREAAKTTLDGVAAMFAAAELNLEQMLAAGPDSLKAHIASLDQSTELNAKLTAAETRATDAEAKLAAANQAVVTITGERDTATATLSSNAAVFSVFGLKASATAEENKKALDEHVAKAAALVLAKDGRPPVEGTATPPAKIEAAPDTGLKGFARVLAAFEAKVSAKDAR